jgi:F0F1-type ATP synthase gamma subunit
MVTGSFNLSAFKHVIRKVKNSAGVEVDVIIIPLEVNNLTLHKNGNVYFNLIAFENKTPNEQSTHGIKQSFTKEVRETMTEQQPFFGNLKITDGTPKQQNNVDNGIASEPIDGPLSF